MAAAPAPTPAPAPPLVMAPETPQNSTTSLNETNHKVRFNMDLNTSREEPATVDYHRAKFTPEEWFQNNYAKYYQAFSDRDSAERIQYESQKSANVTLAVTMRTQADVTKKIGERLHDIGFWKYELQRQIDDMLTETDLLLEQKNRLERALDTVEIVVFITTDDQECRTRRQIPDLVDDIVDFELMRELYLGRSVQDLLRRSIAQAKRQIQKNREAKHRLEFDWSDKLEAYNIDVKCGTLNNQSTDIEYHPDSVKFPENSSTPETWAAFTLNNINFAEEERLRSLNLRLIIDNVLYDTSDDLRNQCNIVNEAFAKRCEEMNDTKTKLENHLKKVLSEIGSQEHNIAMLKQAIYDEGPPMRIAQTRLYHRSHRPNIEQCNDPVENKLMSEVGEIAESIEILNGRLREAEDSLRKLEDTRMMLEKDIACKTNSLFIDTDKCLRMRERYPTVIKLLGYQ